jgi:hypothetical protein
MFNGLGVKIPVVFPGEIVHPAFKQPHDPIGGMRGHSEATRGTVVTGRFNGQFGTLLALYHGQLNLLSIFKSNFRERFKNSVFVKSFDTFCHERTSVS